MSKHLSSQPLATDAPQPAPTAALAALQRAALKARELAVQTGTDLIVSHNGQVRHIPPQSLTKNVA